MQEKKIVVLISGSGSNLQAFIDFEKEQKLGGKIVAVLSNKKDVVGLTRAKRAAIDTIIIEHSKFNSRQAFDQAMADEINNYQPDLVILAGFMRILTPDFVKIFNGKLLNIHPSLLPKYPGLHTHKKALENKDEFHGTSVHFVTEKLDGGPLIAQAKMALENSHSEQQVMARIQKLEHQLYPQVAAWYLNGRLKLEKDGVYFDHKKLQQPIILTQV